MTAVRHEILPWLILIIFLFVSLNWFGIAKIDKIIKRYWFKKRSKISWAALASYWIGLVIIAVTLLDFRGPIQKSEVEISNQYTIILLDSSTSMLVEDIRPNRFKKAIMLARHFIQSSAGHFISVVVFSDYQKKVIPFTDDVDMLDSRVASLEDSIQNSGSSNLSQALKESINYLKVETGKDVHGNILIISDFEEHEMIDELNIPDAVSVAALGVGTSSGGPIPIRDLNGVFRGYKKFNNENIASKLDEGVLKKYLSKIKNFKYWITLSYSLPTEEILNFFRDRYEQYLNKGSATTRPLAARNIWIVGLVMMLIGLLMKKFKGFVYVSLLIIFLMPFSNTNADNEDKDLLPNDYIDMNKIDRLKLANKLISQDSEDAVTKGKTIFKENIGSDVDKFKATNNLAVAEFKTKNLRSGLDRYYEGYATHKINTTEETVMRQNIVQALMQKKEQDQKKQKDENEDNKENKNNKDENKGNDNKEGQNKKSSEKPSKPNENPENKKEDKDKGKNKEQNKNETESKDNKSVQEKLKEHEKKIKTQKKMQNASGILKQIVDEDRKLQGKYLDTSTSEQNIYDSKDW